VIKTDSVFNLYQFVKWWQSMEKWFAV